MNVGGIVVQEVYVVSDLHLGGEAPFQIFREGPALAAIIDELRESAVAGSKRAFVINGDFVDFLAEQPARHFDPLDAGRKLRRISQDPAFEPVFAALRRFVRTPGCLLGIVLGNHDIELALPWVRQELLDILCGGDDAAAGRVHWALDGQGLLLRMRSADGPRVFCTHGNEVDGWNVVEHEALRKFGRAAQRGEPLDLQYKPNPGSRMVIDVMNEVKKRYPFVDLLKPETEAVVPILATLEPNLLRKLGDIAEFRVRTAANDARIAAGLLGKAAELDEWQQDGSGSMYATVMKAEAQAAKYGEVQALLDTAEERFRAGHFAMDLVDVIERGGTLGVWNAVRSYATSRGDKVEALRGHLSDLAEDRSFDLSDEDPTYISLNEKVSTTVDFLVTGHTHLARAITRDFARSYYYNTGTWARVFRIEPDVLQDASAFRRLFTALSAGAVSALDGEPGLEPVRPHFAAFWHDAQGVHGELRQVASGAPATWSRVHRTHFVRS